MFGTKSLPLLPGAALVFGLLVLSEGATTGAMDSAVPSALRSQIDSAIARVKPALVRIRVVATDYSEGREVKMQTVGSGAIITKEGYIITNHHVAGHAVRIFCTLWNREEIEAELVGTDPLTDIAVVKLKPERPVEFKAAEFGDSSRVQVGEYVLAMGSPMALSQSVTLGIISNTEMTMPRFWGSARRFRLDGEDVGSLVRWIGHDAAIYGGNSGGPLVNLRGKIIGINEISYGLGGAIPGNLARNVANQLMSRGQVQRSWFGLDLQPLFKRSADKRGVLISGVIEHSPADRAGFKPGDVLLRLGGSATDVRFEEQMPDVMWRLANAPVGQEVTAVVKRDGKEITLRAVPVERDEAFPPQQELKPWGLTVRNFSSLLAEEMKRPGQAGVLVTSVRPGGPAGNAKPALQARDVILEVNQQPVQQYRGLAGPDPEVDRRPDGARPGHRQVRAESRELPDGGENRPPGPQGPRPGSHQSLAARRNTSHQPRDRQTARPARVEGLLHHARLSGHYSRKSGAQTRRLYYGGGRHQTLCLRFRV